MELFNVKEAAEKLKISEKQLRRDMQAGKIDYVRLGPRRIRVTDQQIEQFIQLNTVTAKKGGRKVVSKVLSSPNPKQWEDML